MTFHEEGEYETARGIKNTLKKEFSNFSHSIMKGKNKNERIKSIKKN